MLSILRSTGGSGWNGMPLHAIRACRLTAGTASGRHKEASSALLTQLPFDPGGPAILLAHPRGMRSLGFRSGRDSQPPAMMCCHLSVSVTPGMAHRSASQLCSGHPQGGSSLCKDDPFLCT